jgi:hypothetical protein
MRRKSDQSPASDTDDGKEVIKKVGAIKGAVIGGAAGAAAGGAAASAVATSTVPLVAAGSWLAGALPLTGIPSAMAASLPMTAVVLLASPLGAAVATGALTVVGAAAGYKIAKVLAAKL